MTKKKETKSIVPAKTKYDNYSVTQHNQLITTGKFNFSLNEYKMLLILASTIQPEDETFTKQVFKATDLAKLLQTTPQAMYQELPKITRKLVKCYIEAEFEGDLIQTHLLVGARHRRGSGLVELQLSDDLKPFYLQLRSRFTTYKLKYILNLNSKYSIRFYEFFQCYADLGGHVCSLDYLKELMVLTQKTYSRYNDFKRKILVPAIEEINEKTDLTIEFEEIKEGRKVSLLEFKIKAKKAQRVKKEPLALKKVKITSSIEVLSGIVSKIKSMTKVEISLEEAQLILNTSAETQVLLNEAYQILSLNTHNPVGAMLDYFKNPTKYNPPIKKPIRVELLTSSKEEGAALTEEEAAERIQRMKELQSKILGSGLEGQVEAG